MYISPDSRYKKINEKFQKFETSNMSPNIKILWDKGEGIHVSDKFKKKYIDFTSGIFTTNIGHNNKFLQKKILKVLKKGITHSYHYFNNPRQKYIEELINFVNKKNLDKCHLVSSGTEATETALKLIKTYGKTLDKKKTGIICISGNWHGRTVGSQMLSGKNKQSEWIGYFDKSIHHIDFPYPWSLKSTKQTAKNFFKKSIKKKFGSNYNFRKNISAILLETFQGWGAIFYPKDYVKEIEKFCKKNNILLCFDEMQSGFCRTGKNFGFEHYNVSPDLICCGKGMGSGFPISGVITSKKIIENKYVSGLSSTHSANPLSCEAGLATIQFMRKNKLANKTKKLGLFFHKFLKKLNKKYPSIVNITLGKGLIGSIIFKDAYNLKAREIADLFCNECLKHKLLVCNTGRESVKLGPPLIINKKQLIEALNIIDISLDKTINKI